MYEFALSPDDDVSSNPGFETLLNIYDNADKDNIAPKRRPLSYNLILTT